MNPNLGTMELRTILETTSYATLKNLPTFYGN
jgi:hypothetical protein